jgi:PIN like domain
VAVRYYVDADTLGLARILAALRIDVTYPGDPGATIKRRKRPVCPVTSTAVPDDQWIPIVAGAGWSIITRDQRIRSRPAEIAAVTAYRAKVFAITSNERLSNWHQLEIVMCQWRRIEQLGEQDGPFVYSVTRTAVSPLLKPPGAEEIIQQ